jgi:hypothetical protein
VPSIGPNNPDAAESRLAGPAWSSPLGVTANGGGVASAGGAVGNTQYLLVRDFDFNIPADATIVGIVVEIRRRSSFPGDYVKDNFVGLTFNGNTGNGQRTDAATWWPNALTYKTYGGPTDMWGSTPGLYTPAILNDPAAFGVYVSANLAQTFASAEIDHVRATVHYVLSATVGGAGVATSEVVPGGTMHATATVDGSGQGIESEETHGVAVTGYGFLGPSGIPSAEGFGTGTMGGLVVLDGTGAAIATDETWGTGAVLRSMTPAGIASAEAHGTGTATPQVASIALVGLASAEQFGTTVLRLTSYGAGIPSQEALGVGHVSKPDDAEVRRRQRVDAGLEWDDDPMRRFALVDQVEGGVVYGARGRYFLFAPELRDGEIQTADDHVAESLEQLGVFIEIDPVTVT